MTDTTTRVWKPSDRMIEIVEKEAVTPEEVKDVIIECFCYAHGDYEQALYIMKSQSIEVGMLWEKPDKMGLMKIVPKLAEVAKDFRNPEIIMKNKQKVENLLRKCSEE